MPELPEVETVRRALQTHLDGESISKVTLNREGLRTPFPKDLKKRLEGKAVERIERRAKYILVYVAGGDIFVLHLGMSGRILVNGPGRHAEPAKHDHLVIETKNGQQIVFRDPRRFGMAFIVSSDQLNGHPAFERMGPEPLEKDFTGPVLAEALKGRKTPIKSALLDQHLVAGIGNIYACEALFESAISPLRSASDITNKEAVSLAAAIRLVLEKAIASGGSSLRDYRQTNGDMGYFQHQFSVYDREGKACPGCTCDVEKAGGIQRITQGGRSTFYCPRKQK